MQRHFTVTGFLVDGDRTALHWHRKSQMWLPPGGHVEPDEDPVQAVLREVLEETGIAAEIVAAPDAYSFDVPQRLPPPMLILVEDIPWPPERTPGADRPHQHIDMLYALRPLHSNGNTLHEDFAWISEEQLRRGEPLTLASCGVETPAPEDVRQVALAAIRIVRQAGATQPY